MANYSEETVKVMVLVKTITIGKTKKEHKRGDKITLIKRLYECHKNCFELLTEDEKAEKPAKAEKAESKDGNEEKASK